MKVRRSKIFLGFGVSFLLCTSFVGVAQAETSAPFDSVAGLKNFVQSNPVQFGDMFVDGKTNTVTVNVLATTPLDSLRRVTRTQVRATADNAGLSGSPSVVTRTVEHSDAELESVMREVTSTEPWASDVKDLLAGWGIVPSENRVSVGLTSVTPALIAEAKNIFGDRVEVHQQDRATTLADSVATKTAPKIVKVDTGQRGVDGASKQASAAVAGPPLLDSEPYVGGDRMVRLIYNADGTARVVQCTVAGEWDLSGGYAMATAGHCGQLNLPWQQGYYDQAANTIYESGPMGTPYVTAFQQNNADAMLMDNGAWVPLMWENTTGTYNIAQVKYAYTPLQGQTVCADGSFTGTKCSAVVTVPNGCATFQNYDPDLDQEYSVTMCYETTATSGEVVVKAGDSGGAVFYGHPSDGVGAVGVISAGNDQDGSNTVWFTNRAGMQANFVGDFAHL